MIPWLTCTTHPLSAPRPCLGQCPREKCSWPEAVFHLYQIKGQRRQVRRNRVYRTNTLALVSSLSSVMFCGRLWWLAAQLFQLSAFLKWRKSFLPRTHPFMMVPTPITRLSPQRDSGKQLLGSAVRQRLEIHHPPSCQGLGSCTSKGQKQQSAHLNKPGEKGTAMAYYWE